MSTSGDGMVEVSQAFAGESVTGETAALYFALRNRAGEEDTLEAVMVEGAAAAEIHEAGERDGMRVMSPVPALPLPAGEITRLVPGGTHVMLFDLSSRPVAGDSLVGVLRFRSGREVSLRAVVRGLTELEEVVPDGARRSDGQAGSPPRFRRIRAATPQRLRNIVLLARHPVALPDLSLGAPAIPPPRG